MDDMRRHTINKTQDYLELEIQGLLKELAYLRPRLERIQELTEKLKHLVKEASPKNINDFGKGELI